MQFSFLRCYYLLKCYQGLVDNSLKIMCNILYIYAYVPFSSFTKWSNLKKLRTTSFGHKLLINFYLSMTYLRLVIVLIHKISAVA